MAPLFRPAMMPSPPSATALTAAASVTIENTTSAPAAAARGVGAKRIPAAMSGSAFALLRVQPVTEWPAAMSRGAMPAPIAPSPTKPMSMPLTSHHRVKRDDAAERQQRLGCDAYSHAGSPLLCVLI